VAAVTRANIAALGCMFMVLSYAVSPLDLVCALVGFAILELEVQTIATMIRRGR
jgi:uncharacterized membrane protein YkvA (DUF1232 family)